LGEATEKELVLLLLGGGGVGIGCCLALLLLDIVIMGKQLLAMLLLLLFPPVVAFGLDIVTAVAVVFELFVEEGDDGVEFEDGVGRFGAVDEDDDDEEVDEEVDEDEVDLPLLLLLLTNGGALDGREITTFLIAVVTAATPLLAAETEDPLLVDFSPLALEVCDGCCLRLNRSFSLNDYYKSIFMV
jgi:hypothetical protein